MAVVGRLVGATLEEVGFFLVRVIRFRIGGVRYQIGLIPFGGYARFKGDDIPSKKKDGEEILFAADAEPPGFNDLHPLKRIAAFASGCTVLVVLGMACLGPWPAIRSLGRGFDQYVPFLPWTPAWVPGGRELARRCVALIKHESFLVVLGLLATKIAAANLLPIPTLNGGQILITLIGWKARIPEKIGSAVSYVGLGIAMFLFLYWIFQFAALLLTR